LEKESSRGKKKNTELYYPAPSTAPSIGNPLTNEGALNELQLSYHGSTFLTYPI
jgi:hypothetical protein